MIAGHKRRAASARVPSLLRQPQVHVKVRLTLRCYPRTLRCLRGVARHHRTPTDSEARVPLRACACCGRRIFVMGEQPTTLCVEHVRREVLLHARSRSLVASRRRRAHEYRRPSRGTNTSPSGIASSDSMTGSAIGRMRRCCVCVSQGPSTQSRIDSTASSNAISWWQRPSSTHAVVHTASRPRQDEREFRSAQRVPDDAQPPRSCRQQPVARPSSISARSLCCCRKEQEREARAATAIRALLEE